MAPTEECTHHLDSLALTGVLVQLPSWHHCVTVMHLLLILKGQTLSYDIDIKANRPLSSSTSEDQSYSCSSHGIFLSHGDFVLGILVKFNIKDLPGISSLSMDKWN